MLFFFISFFIIFFLGAIFFLGIFSVWVGGVAGVAGVAVAWAKIGPARVAAMNSVANVLMVFSLGRSSTAGCILKAMFVPVVIW